ncbi:flagellar motor switch phosphatase FliY [Catonella massiliensis]|uniref:Flagellar motor switch phosphatase FliY n=1 Tax=Catonella massiliensis TaxID=2799636 RepID=A0ABS1J032_9FIRM|nr:flagellar motor switch phosphatase FliY [Catonella massiliensis]MBK5897486.1 flagellar motor switch phosphatase FliY [Catonella massiliensis]
MDGMLSQEEINALLGGMGEDGGSDSSDTQAGAGSVPLSSEEKDAIGEISNISMGTAATTLSTLLNQKVLITTPNVSIANWEDISQSYDRPCVFIQISYIEGLDGNNILILREKDVKIITDLMMGGNGEDVDGTELSELHLSAICEAMNQMMGSAATSISSVLEKKVDISPPTASLIDMDGSIDEEGFGDFLKGEFVKVSFRLEIGTLIDSELMQLYPIDFAKELYNKFMSSSELDQPAPAAPAPAPAPAPAAPTPGPAPAMPVPPQGYAQPMQPAQPVNVAPAQFQAFDNTINPLMQQENIGLIMDVPLEVTVELGRTNKTIKEILDFSPGTIIELNKLAGEAIDLLVNGKYVAKGEVVVIEDNFGIRITEIIK